MSPDFRYPIFSYIFLIQLLFLVVLQAQNQVNQFDACNGGIVLDEEAGLITSPNYPKKYDNNLDCQWTIMTDSNKLIEISFLDFQLEQTFGCEFDYLQVIDNNTTYTGSTFCGDRKPNNFASSSNVVKIIFTTDSSKGFKGFLLSWANKARCSEDEFMCWNGSCISKEKQCNRISDCADSSDEIECAQPAALTECGKQDVAPQFSWDPRIIGGDEAKPKSWPWQAMLVDGSNKFSCGGSIIHKRLILTAGHCVYPALRSIAISVYLGRHITGGNEGEEFFPVSRIILHPDYDDISLRNDIALLQLEKPINYSSTMRSICLSHFDSKLATSCIATGWGAINPDNTFVSAPALYQVRLPLVNLTLCNNSYDGSLIESQLCAGALGEGGIDACQGDSGGPLVCLAGDFTWFQVGITSYGDGCGSKTSPGVYTKVSSFSSWIGQHTVWTDACTEGALLSESSGNFTSPNYPENYFSNSSCKWTIALPPGQVIKLFFHDFRLNNSFENDDFMTIEIGNSQNTYRDNSIPDQIDSESNLVTIKFNSGHHNNDRGFLASWKSEDVNECVQNTDNCNLRQNCINTFGSYQCSCISGFREDIDMICEAYEPGSPYNDRFTCDGINCENVDECVERTNNCHSNASCTNIIGSYICYCDDGFSGDGLTCEDVDECVERTNNCHSNASCTNIIGSYICYCDDGFSGDGLACEVFSINTIQPETTTSSEADILRFAFSMILYFLSLSVYIIEIYVY